MKKFKFIIDGSKYEVSVNEIENNVAEIEVNGTPFTVEIEREQKTAVTARPSVKPATVAPAASHSTAAASTMIVKSPLPGSIMKVLVAVGDSVKRGDVLLTMESMKMENNILAEKDGVVKSIAVTTGQSVMQDDLLLIMD